MLKNFITNNFIRKSLWSEFIMKCCWKFYYKQNLKNLLELTIKKLHLRIFKFPTHPPIQRFFVNQAQGLGFRVEFLRPYPYKSNYDLSLPPLRPIFACSQSEGPRFPGFPPARHFFVAESSAHGPRRPTNLFCSLNNGQRWNFQTHFRAHKFLGQFSLRILPGCPNLRPL